MVPDPQRVTEIIREAAVLEVLPRFRSLAREEVMEKAPGDLVTIADLEAERRLTRGLKALKRGSQVIGEEAVGKDRSTLARLSADGPIWLVDPVDGTRNFAAGRTPFAVVVAYLEDGAVRAGWIHNPVTGDTAIAVAGEGAWSKGRKLRAAPPAALEAMIGMVDFAAFGRDCRARTKERAEVFREVRNWRCAGHDFVLLARGEKHFSLYNRLWPWDHAAGVLMYHEAGGHYGRIDATPYRPIDRVEGLLLAPDRESWHRIRDHLAGA